MEKLNEKIEKLKMKIESKEIESNKPVDLNDEGQFVLSEIKRYVHDEVRFLNNIQYKGIENTLNKIRHGLHERLDYIEKMLEEFIVKNESAKR
jgi:hypothetical protein